MRVWRIVGGEDKGGIVVRLGKDLSSQRLADRLSTGALVEELRLEGGRLHFKLLKGSGPNTGWLSIRLGEKELATLERGTAGVLSGAHCKHGKDEYSDSSRRHSELIHLFGALGHKRALEVITIPAGTTLRIVTISDIHVDFAVNRKWFDKHMPSLSESIFNVLILPGDLCDDITKIKDTLKMFTRAFQLVCYTPGNHDLWVARPNSPADSMAKLQQILQVCEDCQVRTKPVRLHCNLENSAPADVLIVPLLSFYCSEWDKEPDMPWTPEQDVQAWMDFKAIRWPQEIIDQVIRCEGRFCFGKDGTSKTLSEIFAAINEPWLEEVMALRNSCTAAPIVISYSHYLPRQELFPPKRFLVDAKLHKVSGSVELEAQVRRLEPDVHIFGHTHLTVDFVIDDQRYLQWALGSPSEQRAMTKAVSDTGMLVIYDSQQSPPIAPVQETFWGNFFRKEPRDPYETCPASFVRKLFEQRFPDIKLPFDDEYFQSTPNPGPAIMDWTDRFEARWRQ